jgi:RHH-type transcriptional regulator, rel operon repressor / antitoxin RelB
MRTRKTLAAVSKTMTLRLDAATLRRLERLANATDRTKAWLAAEAVKTYLNLNEWQTEAIREAVKKADRRDAKFVSHEEVDAWLATWGAPRERKPPL